MRKATLRSAGAAVVLLVTAVLATMPSAAAEPGTAATSLRVMNYNIHFAVGQGSPAPAADIDQIVAEIKAQQPDVVTLQEVHRNSKQSEHIDQVATLADELGMTPVFGDNDTSAEPGSQQPSFEGTHGNVILSRFPVLEKVNYHLPRAASDSPARVTRGMVGAKLDVRGTEVRVYSTQLTNGVGTASKASRDLQVDFILDKIGTIGPPVLLTGDFNTEGGPVDKVTGNGFADTAASAGKTSPANNPKDRIDYVFAKSFSAKGAKVPSINASDHRPVVVDLTR